MAFVKACTFKRTVKFSRPGPDLDTLIDASFVAEFAPIKANEFEAMRAAGEIRDTQIAAKVLVSVDSAMVADVLEDEMACSAVALTYYNALREGIAAKNSVK